MTLRGKALVIDGSNAVCAVFGSRPGALQEQNRDAADFLERLSRWAGHRKSIEIEIVFDGAYRALLPSTRAGNVRVLFSHPESADSVIVERARALRFYGNKVTVVTWDRQLAQSAEAEEAKVIGPDRLWDWMR